MSTRVWRFPCSYSEASWQCTMINKISFFSHGCAVSRRCYYATASFVHFNSNVNERCKRTVTVPCSAHCVFYFSKRRLSAICLGRAEGCLADRTWVLWRPDDIGFKHINYSWDKHGTFGNKNYCTYFSLCAKKKSETGRTLWVGGLVYSLFPLSITQTLANHRLL